MLTKSSNLDFQTIWTAPSGGASTTYYIDLIYNPPAGSAITNAMFASNYSTNLPPSFLVSLFPAQSAAATTANSLYIANSKLLTASSNFMIMPAATPVFLYANGTNTLVNWSTTQSWTTLVPGSTRVSVSNFSTVIPTSFGTSGVAGTGAITGIGPTPQSANGFRVVRILYSIYSDMI